MKRALIFWMWNDVLDPQEIKRQIKDFHAHRINGFFIHAMPEEFRQDDFPGGMPGYLSEEFFAMIKVAVEYSATLGMQVWLYDEGGWPSGTLNGRMLQEHPELILHSVLPSGEIVPYPERPDLFNPETTAIFIRETHEKYASHVGQYFGNVIPGIFTDEPFFGKFLPDKMLPWSPVIAKRFRECKGYDAMDAAMLIMNHKDPVAQQDYTGVISMLIRESFLQPVARWCHEHNLLSTGHFNGDDSAGNIRELLGGDIFSLHQDFDICGCDAIWRQIHPLVPETDFSRLTASAAGKKLCISETFAVYGSDLSLAEMKQISAMQFVSGVNIISPMAVHYSNRNSRQITTVANFYGADTRWQNFTLFSDFITRMSHVFDRTEPVIKASVNFPRRELQNGGKYEDFFAAGLKLASQQITYDYQPDAGKLPENIERDILTDAPCPELRTRHLRSPRGERRIFVNSGLTEISCTFAAPKGYNVWYDPANGKRKAARTDANGKLTLTLPFAGTAVLLTIPGKMPLPVTGRTVKKQKKMLTFRPCKVVRMIKASADGLTEVPPPENIPEKFSGTLRCEADVVMPESTCAELVLPEALRAMVKLEVNGKKYDVKAWQPYLWIIQLAAGNNCLTLDITNTPAEAMNAPEHTAFLKENGYFNSYIEMSQKFEPIFPDENPVANAFLLCGE